MNGKGEIQAYDGIHCIECGKELYSYDEYYAIKPNKMGALKFRGRWIHIHKACYEKLLPKNKKLRK